MKLRKLKIIAALVYITAPGTLLAQNNGEPIKKIADDDKLTANGMVLSRASVEKIILRKLNLLGTYFVALAKKSDPNPEKIIKQAMALFNNDETVKVSVSSATRGTVVTKNIRKYLKDMSMLPYADVEVSYSKVFAVQNLVKRPDGAYEGTVTLQQEFTGFNAEGKPQYHDITEKTVKVIVKVTDVIKDGALASYLDIFFRDMKVVEKKQ